MPIGVQIIGQRGYDGRLLRIANNFLNHLACRLSNDGC